MCGSAYQTVRDFQPGERRFFLSKGQFSFVDLAIALTHQIGPCDFRCAVWTGTRASIEAIGTLVDSQRIRSADWILCDSQRSMNEGRIEDLIRIFGVEHIRVVPLHAKLMTIANDDWQIVVQSSANMTENRSVEQFDVSDSSTLCRYVGDFFDQVFDDVDPLSKTPPFDGVSYEEVEQTYQSLCLGDHFEAADVMDVSPVGVADGLR